MTQADLCLRGIMSVQWIWCTYAILTGAHDLLALLFVSLLGWDQPEEWSALYGPLTEAYSLRRFWGVFWHRLHVAPFEAYMPLFLAHGRRSVYRPPLHKAARALWMFLVSATCHATINWIVLGKSNAGEEFRFFLCNYAVCTVESILGVEVGRRLQLKDSPITRLLGYFWVLGVLFCLVPSWQYSLVYIARDYR